MKKDKLLKNIANNIRQLRAKYRYSQDILAEKANISTHYLSDLENEKGNPSVEKLINLAEALDVTLNDLVY